MSVVCPEGLQPGDMIVISHPDTGEDVEGEVPEGKFPSVSVSVSVSDSDSDFVSVCPVQAWDRETSSRSSSADRRLCFCPCTHFSIPRMLNKPDYVNHKPCGNCTAHSPKLQTQIQFYCALVLACTRLSAGQPVDEICRRVWRFPLCYGAETARNG